MPDKERFLTDVPGLSHMSVTAHRIGCLKALSVLPCLPGDVISWQLDSVVRISPLNKNLLMDFVVDFAWFFVPYRHIYGYDAWRDYCVEGPNESINLTTLTPEEEVYCVGHSSIEADRAVSAHHLVPLARIYNEYFRLPSDSSRILDDDFLVDADSLVRRYGPVCAHLPAPWTLGVNPLVVDADRRFALVDTDKIDLTLLAQQKGKLASVRASESKAQSRLRDYYYTRWGVHLNTDAEQRPTLLIRRRVKVSGHDVNGTTADTIGYYGGRGIDRGGAFLPRFKVPEHGAIWMLALVRVPVMHNREVHLLTRYAQPTTKMLLADPLVLQHEPPFDHTPADHFRQSTDATVIGRQPYANWYRTHPNMIDNTIAGPGGYPTLFSAIDTFDDAHYPDPTEYDHGFNDQVYGHVQIQALHNIACLRNLPLPGVSIMAGTD